MAEVTPVRAASVLVLRDVEIAAPRHSPYEVLMIRRHDGASFVPSAWVFPGGVAEDLDVDIAGGRKDGTLLGAMRVTAMRELFEETGVWLGSSLADAETRRRRLLAGSLSFLQLLEESPADPRQLIWTSRWITPAGVPRRFDTYFFLAVAPAGAVGTLANEEAVEIAWVTPEEALASFKMVFPTVRNLEAIRGQSSAAGLLASRRGVEIPTMQPVIVDGKIVLP